MDVSLSGRRVFVIAFLSFSLISCGNRYDLSTASGQQARIDDANYHLSHGECGAADEAINPLYNSPYVTPQVRIVKASAQACFAHFKLLTFATNLSGASNYFVALAKSLDNVAGDSARTYMYNAADVLSQNGGAMGATQRTSGENAYMVFVQFGVISSIIRNYGNADSNGAKQTAFAYNPGAVSDQDACALAAAFSFISDSFSSAGFTDADSQGANNALNSICVAGGYTSCASLNRDRTKCGVNGTPRTDAKAVVTSVNTDW